MQVEMTGSIYRRWGKRTVDVVLGSVLSLVSLPLILVLSVGSLVAFRAWPIFVQPRVGRGGRLFRCLKIRTLPTSAPRAADKHEVVRVETNAYGRFLRKTHLDELPQLLLVPVGTMSLVGPRPAIPELLGHFSARALDTRLRVRPGCTGLWQISEAACGAIYNSPEYDRFYVRNYSSTLDLRILRRTCVLMLRAVTRPVRERAPYRADPGEEATLSSSSREHVAQEYA